MNVDQKKVKEGKKGIYTLCRHRTAAAPGLEITEFPAYFLESPATEPAAPCTSETSVTYSSDYTSTKSPLFLTNKNLPELLPMEQWVLGPGEDRQTAQGFRDPLSDS